jgi:hypothetical protein
MVTSVLVILSFALVLVAVVLLVLGLLTTSGLGLIYASMACSLFAGIVLYAAIRMGRPRMQEATAGAPMPAPSRPATTLSTPRVDEGERVTAATAPQREAVGTVAVLERDEPAGGPDDTAALEPEVDEEFDDEVDDDFFPIADYDDLNVSEIMPLLPELYPEELDEVEEHERSTKGRVTILTRIQELREDARRREAGEEWDVPDDGWRDEGAAEGVGTPSSFPIAGYDNMTSPEITRRLADLSPDDLVQVRAREQAVDARVTVLREIDRLLDEAGAPTAPAAPADRPARVPASRPARKATAKRSPAKKAAARRASAAAPSRKATAKRSPAKKAAGTKRPATKRAAATKAAPRKAAAKKAAPRKSAAKKSAAKKSAAKKSAKRSR